MVEIELKVEELTNQDNTVNVEMSNAEIWLIKHLLNEYKPKKIVEIGISAGGNTVNLLNWKDKDAQLFSIDIATQWYKDETKLSGFMADELDVKDNWKIYRGSDYLDVYEDIGNDIDFIIIDTVHALPGEFLTFLVSLPQLKDGCIVVLHDIHLNMKYFLNDKFNNFNSAAYCNGLLYAGVTSAHKWTVEVDTIPNIGAFVADKSTRDNIKDIFHLLCATWFKFPNELNMEGYLEYVRTNYPLDCYNMFKDCIELQSKYFDKRKKQSKKKDKKKASADNSKQSKKTNSNKASNNNSKVKKFIKKYI